MALGMDLGVMALGMMRELWAYAGTSDLSVFLEASSQHPTTTANGTPVIYGPVPTTQETLVGVLVPMLIGLACLWVFVMLCRKLSDRDGDDL